VATAGTASSSGYVHPRRSSHPHDREGDQGTREHQWLHVGREEQRDDGDRDEVVDDGQGEQERPQGWRQMGPDDGQHCEGEGDVGRRRDRPAAHRGAVAAEREDGDGIQDRGEGHPCEGGGDGDDRLGAVGKVAADELPFELDSRDEEEEGEQAVGRPLPEGEIQVQGGGGTDAGVPQAVYAVCHGEFAQARATTVAPSRSMPPTVSVRRMSPRCRDSRSLGRRRRRRATSKEGCVMAPFGWCGTR
jgi:hypothetical protein